MHPLIQGLRPSSLHYRWMALPTGRSSEMSTRVSTNPCNAEYGLRDAGGKDWSQLFRVDLYLMAMDDEALEAMTRNFRNGMPDHQPIRSGV